MRAELISSSTFALQFESEEELREEYRTNLAIGGLRLPGVEPIPLHSAASVTLRGPWGAETTVQARAVALLPDGVALMIESDASRLLETLLANRPLAATPPAAVAPSPPRPRPSIQETEDRVAQTAWDRVRSLSQLEKSLLAVKAERSERALLLQDNDPRVLLSLLKNPRLTIDEVTRIAKSTFLTYQVAEAIAKTPQWMANLDVRIALVHNTKTPPQYALRILPTLPEAEVRAIARASPNMALKQAALRRLHGT